MTFDYIFPNWAAKALRKPSERTQMESTMVGITLMILGSLFVASYFVINGDLSTMMKIAISVSELGILSFQFGLLASTYQTYYSYKLEKGYYPEDYKLKIQLEQANKMIQELQDSVNKLMEVNKC